MTRKLYGPEDYVKRLLDLVCGQIEIDPFPYDDQTWAAMPLAWYVEQLGLCDRQVRRIVARLIKDSVITKDRTSRDGKQVMLLRPGKQGYSRKQQQKLLALIIEEHIGRDHKPSEFGLCGGYVDAWGDKAAEYLKTVLKHWPEFCAYAKCGHVKYARWFETPSEGLRFLLAMKHIVPKFVAEVQLGHKQGWL